MQSEHTERSGRTFDLHRAEIRLLRSLIRHEPDDGEDGLSIFEMQVALDALERVLDGEHLSEGQRLHFIKTATRLGIY